MTPTFTAINTLVVDKAGSGAGTVSGARWGIDCGRACGGRVVYNTTAGLTASPAPGSLFVGWSGCDYVSYDVFCAINVKAITHVTAQFVAGKTVRIAPAGGGTHGTVTIDPGGTSCDIVTTCAALLKPGASVKLTAASSLNTRFVGWSGGDCSGSATTCSFTLNSDAEIVPRFVDFHTVTVGKSGSGAGTVSSDAAGIDCGASCSANADHGSTLTLTATPDAGSRFVGWSGGG